ncbi:MAG: metallopeptidase family protein [Anaerolineae bacterium]
MTALSRSEFEALVAQALDDLPPYFHVKMNNVEVIVETAPTLEDYRQVGGRPGGVLLGLYVGIPLTARTSGYQLVPPDTIRIFQQPIEQLCRTPEEVRQQVRHTVIHELAHHFGISDARLRELGAY